MVPAERVLSLCVAVGFVAIRLSSLRPDLYPHPDDGLPEHPRGRCHADPVEPSTHGLLHDPRKMPDPQGQHITQR